MDAAAAIIDALNARGSPRGRLREATRTSWGAWLSRMAERPGRGPGAPAQDLVDQLAARPLSPPPRRSASPGRLAAFASLLRQQWHPASRDERGLRWAAGGTSVAWHLLLIVVILWVTTLHFLPPPPPRDADAVQVEFIGVGTPAEEGGGEAPAPGDAPSASAAATSAAPRAQPSPSAPAADGMATEAAAPPVPDIQAPVPDMASRDVPEPTPAPQPLAVTTPVSPEPPVFELPPTTPPAPPVARPELARAPPLREVEIPEPVRAPPADIAPVRVAVEPLERPTPTVARREVPTPVRLPALRAPVVAPTVPDITVTAAQPAPRSVPTPDAAAAARPTAAVAASQAPVATSSRPAGVARPAEGSRAAGPTIASPSPGVGAGPRPTPAPGSWATPRRADDWGVSDRNRPGRGDGVRDAAGGPRVGAAPGSAAPGRPPGMHTEEIADLDRAGTWLKRKPHAYEPTRFDRFWRPNETLLQEWVRRGIKQVSILIPGTSKSIVCGISILQLGGGCWPVDSNLNEQPANARPPPDIPFKPGLQEDPGTTPTPAKPPAG